MLASDKSYPQQRITKMIEQLKNNKKEVSEKIRSVFQVSYAVEAKLLKAVNFPPLQRPLEDFIKSNTEFFGFMNNEKLAGVIEIDHNKNATLICSLVVNPLFFRQGIARKLMEFTLNAFDSSIYTVETGVENGPATELYKKFGFTEVKQWDTNHGVRKIRFEYRKDK
ncbi:MAG: ribosomal protein S18 acetylase RimI-like enzyme [Flavobacteriaceae bacterium]|jgi:ribosomal protein S18 acetylase RimI-like enzyme